MGLKKIIEEKRLWKQHVKRVKALPNDYQIVYKQITTYLYNVGVEELNTSFQLFIEIVDLFEDGVACGKNAIEITGKDVASFCDNLIAGKPNTYTKINNCVCESIQSSYQQEIEKHK